MSDRADGQEPTDASSRAVPGGYIGVVWLLETVATEDHETTQVPARYAVGIGLHPVGKFVMFDSVNTLSGTYRLTSDGFVVTSTGTTLKGHGQGDAGRTTVLAAIHELGFPDPRSVAPARVVDERLELQTASYRLLFRQLPGAPLMRPHGWRRLLNG